MNERRLTVYYSYNGRKEIPCIRLQGEWVKSQGFRTGDKLNVSSDDGIITIRLMNEKNLVGSR